MSEPEGLDRQTAGDPAKVGRRRATIDVGVQIVGRALNLALGVVVTIVLVRTLGDDNFGQWSTVFAVVGMAGYLGDLGFQQVAVRQAAADPEREAEWFGALLTFRLTIAAPVTLICAVLLLILATTPDMRILGLLASATNLVGAVGSLSAVFQLRVRNDVPTLMLTLNSVLWGGAVITIAALNGGMVALGIAFLVAAAITAGVQALLALRTARIKVRGSTAHWRALARLGIPVGIAGMLTLAYAQIDQVLVFQLAGADDAGRYGAAYRLLDSSRFIPTALMTSLFPIIAASYVADKERVRRLIQLAADYLAIASLPLLAFTIAAATPVMSTLFGPEFADGAAALPILMGAFVAISFGYLAGNMIIVMELQRRFVIYAVAGLVLNVVANVLLIPPFGFVAAAWVTLATELLVLTLSVRLVLRSIEMRPALGRLARTIVAAAIMGGVVAALNAAGASVAVLAAAAVVAYPAMLFALRVITVEEIVLMARREPAA